MSPQSRYTKLRAANGLRRSSDTDGLQVSVMGHQLTPILLNLLLLSACGASRTPPPPPPVQSVAEVSEIRTWVLKAHWAEEHDEIAEALRCWKWVLRLDGDNPEAVNAAKAFAKRNGIEF